MLCLRFHLSLYTNTLCSSCFSGSSDAVSVTRVITIRELVPLLFYVKEGSFYRNKFLQTYCLEDEGRCLFSIMGSCLTPQHDPLQWLKQLNIEKKNDFSILIRKEYQKQLFNLSTLFIDKSERSQSTLLFFQRAVYITRI